MITIKYNELTRKKIGAFCFSSIQFSGIVCAIKFETEYRGNHNRTHADFGKFTKVLSTNCL